MKVCIKIGIWVCKKIFPKLKNFADIYETFQQFQVCLHSWQNQNIHKLLKNKLTYFLKNCPLLYLYRILKLFNSKYDYEETCRNIYCFPLKHPLGVYLSISHSNKIFLLSSPPGVYKQVIWSRNFISHPLNFHFSHLRTSSSQAALGSKRNSTIYIAIKYISNESRSISPWMFTWVSFVVFPITKLGESHEVLLVLFFLFLFSLQKTIHHCLFTIAKCYDGFVEKNKARISTKSVGVFMVFMVYKYDLHK